MMRLTGLNYVVTGKNENGFNPETPYNIETIAGVPIAHARVNFGDKEVLLVGGQVLAGTEFVDNDGYGNTKTGVVGLNSREQKGVVDFAATLGIPEQDIRYLKNFSS